MTVNNIVKNQYIVFEDYRQTSHRNHHCWVAKQKRQFIGTRIVSDYYFSAIVEWIRGVMRAMKHTRRATHDHRVEITHGQVHLTHRQKRHRSNSSSSDVFEQNVITFINRWLKTLHLRTQMDQTSSPRAPQPQILVNSIDVVVGPTLSTSSKQSHHHTHVSHS